MLIFTEIILTHNNFVSGNTLQGSVSTHTMREVASFKHC